MARATKLISLLLLQLANSLSALDFKTFAFEGQFSDLFYVQGEAKCPSTSMASGFPRCTATMEVAAYFLCPYQE